MLDLGLKHITLQVPRAPADLQHQQVKLVFIIAQLQIETNEEKGLCPSEGPTAPLNPSKAVGGKGSPSDLIN